jgi:hypothetical protein
MKYGVSQARRAWVEKGSVINCLPFSEFEKSSGKILHQVVRYELVHHGISEHRLEPPASFSDLGGDAGQQAIPLFRKGHEVAILGPPEDACGAQLRLVLEDEYVRQRVRLIEGTGERAHETLVGRHSTRRCATAF